MNDSRRIALITGGSKGIGKACVTQLSEQGFKVLIHYRSGKDEAEALAASLPEAETFGADLSDPEAAQSMMKDIKAKHGRLDVLVNNAGVCVDQLVMLAKEDAFDKMFSTNMKSIFVMSKFASRLMLKQKWGRIVNITSVVGHMGNPGQSLYSSTKGAVTAFTKSIASELASVGITCNCIAPGFIKTAMTDKLNDEQKAGLMERIPMKRMGTPEDIASAVGFLVSDSAAYISGTTIHVNGGMY